VCDPRYLQARRLHATNSLTMFIYICVHPAVLALEFDPMMMPTDDAMRWWTQMCGEGAHVAVAYVERLYFGELLAALLVRSKKKYSTDQEHHQV
jgi:hypothetical protein